ncbi:hypothetical protein N7468_002095 [Penicillium chermesinum]|uniref:Uncharacterized protein n=1 Tax=Penicillium chermesinum TaxID=63820 RepID=A0A9W9PJ92_9EURO|nr:uncharacterized protein N7468_002095 [Penicillium chermesinum]KAJ5247112.1 hypothetical protein N7468_002095 [Penicillium chermesinum]
MLDIKLALSPFFLLLNPSHSTINLLLLQTVPLHLHSKSLGYTPNSLFLFSFCEFSNSVLNSTEKMCSVYIFEYDCGCTVAEGGVIPCAKKGTPECNGVKEYHRRRTGYNCPLHE